jgi:hypothetical protein
LSAPRLGLQKVRTIEFARISDSEFIAYFLDAEGTPVSIFEPKKIFEGESYKIEFPHDLVIGVPKFEESLDKIL